MRQNPLIPALLLSLAGLGSFTGCKKEQAKVPPPPAAVTIAQPVVREVMDFGDYTGRLEAVDEVEIKARVRGYLDSIEFKDGQQVKKDQVLFVIDQRPFQQTLEMAEGQLGVVKARKVKAEADVKRYRELVPKGAATAQDLDKAIGELGEADAGIRAATAEVDRAKLDLIYSKVIAPFDGLASKANLSIGNLIGGTGTDPVLTTIVKIDPIYVYFDVDERSAQAYRARSKVERPSSVRELNIKVMVGMASEQGHPHEGTIDFIDNKVSASTGTVRVRAELKNPTGALRPGYFARIRIPAGDKYEATMVADRTIGTQQDTKYLLTVDEKNVVKFKPVKLGTLQPGGLRVITAGLDKNDWVVVNGIQRARPDATVNPQKGAMPSNLPATAPAATQASSGK